MRRGEIWTVLADGYARKPRPVVVVQNDGIEGFDSTVVCLMISFTSDDMTTRVKVPPTAQNGLIKISWVMTEKILQCTLRHWGNALEFWKMMSCARWKRNLHMF